MKVLTLPALNIQAPWAELIVSGKKTVETRFYPLPEAYVGKRMLVVQTPGTNKKLKRRVIGVVTFNGSFEYKNRKEFYKDANRHLVDENSDFAWQRGEARNKWGWTIQTVEALEGKIARNQKTGIVFTKQLKVQLPK